MTVAGFSLEEVQSLLRSKQYERLKEILSEVEVDAVAARWAQAAPFERVLLFRLMAASRAEEFFARLPPEQKLFILGSSAPGALGPVLEEIGTARAETIFHKLPEAVIRRMRTSMLEEK